MAHEMAHVALRHGTAQASKAQKYQIGAVAGQILGAIIGGTAGAVVSQGSQFGIGVSFLRFGRAYEKDADILGAQMMARAGYDPVDMANMFRTIEQQGGGGGPEWMSSHPNPGNRSAYITQEARLLRVETPGARHGGLQVRQKPPRGHAACALVTGGRAGRPRRRQSGAAAAPAAAS